jgi:hypothetical protein
MIILFIITIIILLYLSPSHKWGGGFIKHIDPEMILNEIQTLTIVLSHFFIHTFTLSKTFYILA